MGRAFNGVFNGATNGRAASGRFAPGWRGGPGGARPGSGPKPKAAADIRRRLTEHAGEYLDQLQAMAADRTVPHRVRADILKLLLAYAIGKPDQGVECSAQVEVPEARAASTAELGVAVNGSRIGA